MRENGNGHAKVGVNGTMNGVGHGLSLSESLKAWQSAEFLLGAASKLHKSDSGIYKLPGIEENALYAASYLLQYESSKKLFSDAIFTYGPHGLGIRSKELKDSLNGLMSIREPLIEVVWKKVNVRIPRAYYCLTEPGEVHLKQMRYKITDSDIVEDFLMQFIKENQLLEDQKHASAFLEGAFDNFDIQFKKKIQKDIFHPLYSIHLPKI